MIIVYDSRSHDLSYRAVEIDGIHRQISQHLIDLSQLVGYLPESYWLHVQSIERGDTNFTIGLNVFLTGVGMSHPGIIAHELFHVYSIRWSPTTPLFMSEGLADIASYIITGSTLSDPYVTSKQVRLSVMSRGSLTQSQYSEEAANGYQLFRPLLTEVGRDNFKLGLREAVDGRFPTAEKTLKAFKRWAPDPSRVESLYIRGDRSEFVLRTALVQLSSPLQLVWRGEGVR